MIIGVTGKSGSGKTTLSEEIAKRFDGQWIDMDHLCHEALKVQSIIQYLSQKIGNEILFQDGTINRKKLGEVVFSDECKMQELMQVTWNYMEKRVDEMIADNKENKCIILDAIRLPETKYWNICQVKILALASDDARKAQVMKRDHITEEYFQKRDASSIDYDKDQFDIIYECHYQQEDLDHLITTLGDSFIR